MGENSLFLTIYRAINKRNYLTEELYIIYMRTAWSHLPHAEFLFYGGTT